jgi:spermidine/putrescine transport system substrate-binding protein
MDPVLASSSAITMPAGYTGAKPVKPCNNEELSNYSKIWEAFKG